MNVRDKDVTLRIDDTNDIRVRFSRSAISSVVTKEEDEGAKE
jgi:preprotein translocase subunit YajC